MHFVCVAGARPNFMKIKPVMDALSGRGQDVTLVHTGQHYDSGMSEVFFDELGIRAPDHRLDAGSGSHAQQTARVIEAFEPLLSELRPDGVIVVGDVNSTAASALVAAKSGALLAHVEAGLRSRDWSMPEEVNRVVTDRLSDYLFAPSSDAVDNLRSEGYRLDQVHLVGNVMADTLLANLERARARRVPEELGLVAGSYGLVTLHRPSNVDDPRALDGLMTALGKLAAEVPVIFPAHPRTHTHMRDMRIPPGVEVTAPAGYLDFIGLEADAGFVLTDSGGVQEETTVLGVPCLTVRETTERPITISQGTNRLVARDPDRIVEEALRVLRDGAPARRPELWDGRAGDRIAEVLAASGGPAGHRRPTDRPETEPSPSPSGPAIT